MSRSAQNVLFDSAVPFVGIGIGAGMGGLIVAFKLRNFLVGVVNGD